MQQAKEADIANLLEARFHHHQAGQIDDAVLVHGWVVLQLDTWGGWRREEELSEEVLTWVPAESKHAAVNTHRLGIIAQNRGAYDEALDWYRKSLAIEEALGNRAGMASSYHQLGIVSQQRGAYDEALEWYRKSLAIEEELGNRAGMASSYGQLGNVSYLRGAYDDALAWYRKSLAIDEALGNRAGMASSFSQMGILLTERGEAAEAVGWNLRSLAIRMELQVPQVRVDFHWLSRQEAMLGADAFRERVEEVEGGADQVAVVMGLLERYKVAQAGEGDDGDSPVVPASA